MGQAVELTAEDGVRLSAYLAKPEESGATPRHAGIVVCQEIFGVNAYMRQVTERFASQGFTAIAPFLFDRAERGVELGYGQEDMKRGIALRGQIEPAQTLRDIAAAAKALGPIRKAIVGFCWGGSLAWIAATQTDLFDAASSWYGSMVVKTKDATPRCPVQLHFGEDDHSIPMTDVEAIRAAQPEVPVYTYLAGHGFGCTDRPSYEPRSAELAMARTLEFFGRSLRDKKFPPREGRTFTAR